MLRVKWVKYSTLILAVIINTALPAYAKTAEKHNLLVNVSELKQILPKDQTVLLDVRTVVEYSENHLEGAVNIPIANLFSNDFRSGSVISINEARIIFSEAGIDTSTNVVIYDNGSFIDAARAFWVLELYGHNKVSLLDGGYPAWSNAGYSVTVNAPVKKPKNFIPTVVPQRLSTKLSVRLAINDKDTAIVDARGENNYNGKVSRSKRKGHIPNAINIPTTENFVMHDGVSKLLGDKELQALYSPIKDKKRVITYCYKGKESALTYFVLRKLGLNASAYDGSWSEWGNDLQLPIINGQ